MTGSRPPQTANAADSTAARAGRMELFLIAGVMLIGLALRLWHLERLAIEHFDEGVYASNLLFPENDWSYPARHLYAPPLVPALIEWSLILFGATQWAPFIPGILLGTLTIPALGLMTRRWAGTGSGVAAASLLALNDFHISLSRSALTDAPLGFFLVMAVWLLIEALAAGCLLRAALAGLMTGLAWATKYNGWLPLAIGTSGAIAAIAIHWLALKRAQSNREGEAPTEPQTNGSAGASPSRFECCGREKISLRRTAPCLLVAAFVAGAIWFSIWFGLIELGGYGQVAANHRNYVVGFGGWVEGWKKHLAVQEYYSGLLSVISAALATALAAIASRTERSTWNENGSQAKQASAATEADQRDRSTWNGIDDISVWLLSGLLVALLLVCPRMLSLDRPVALLCCVPAAGAIVWFGAMSRWGTRCGKACSEIKPRSWFGGWLIVAWFFGLLLATPLYRAYPRLMLPLLLVAVVLAGAFVGRGTVDVLRARVRGSGRCWSVGAILMALVCLVLNLHPRDLTPRFLESRRGLKEVAEALVPLCRSHARQHLPSSSPDLDIVFYVYGEPGLLYHLAGPRIAVRPIGGLDFLRAPVNVVSMPTFVIAGPHADQSPEFQRDIRAVGPWLDFVDELPYDRSDFVLLDEVKPEQMPESRRSRIKVWHMHSHY